VGKEGTHVEKGFGLEQEKIRELNSRRKSKKKMKEK